MYIYETPHFNQKNSKQSFANCQSHNVPEFRRCLDTHNIDQNASCSTQLGIFVGLVKKNI